MKNVFTDKVQSMVAYDVPSSAGMIKLNDMESPYKLPDEMKEALGKILSMTNINRYPNPRSTSLVAKIKKTFSVPESCKVMLGNGSDELIQLILMATMRDGATVLSPAPSFVMYQQMAEILGMRYVGVDLNADFSLDEQAFLAAIKRENPAVIFLAHPNNPTGMLLSKTFLQQVLESSNGLVVFDEAYTAYADDSALDLIEHYENAVLIRTVSKIGLAGIRLGYLAALPALVEAFDKVRMPYNINVLTQGTARFMLDQMDYFDHNVAKILKEKALLYDWLSARDDVTVFPSQTNFLLVRFDDATMVFERLRDEHKILVKNWHGKHPIMDNILRITIGRKKENAKLRDALNEILG